MDGFKNPNRNWFRSKTFAFLRKYKVTSGENILVLQGGRFRVPDEARSEFMRLYTSECAYFNFSIVECRSKVFPFLADFDHLKPEALAMGDDLWTTLADHLGAAIAAVIDVTPAAAAGVEWQLRRDSENRHAIWPDVLVVRNTALRIRTRAVETLHAMHPDIDWADIIDPSVLDKNGLRLLGSYKCWKLEALETLHPEWSAVHYRMKDWMRTANVSPKGMPYKVIDTASGVYTPAGGEITFDAMMRHSVYRADATAAALVDGEEEPDEPTKKRGTKRTRDPDASGSNPAPVERVSAEPSVTPACGAITALLKGLGQDQFFVYEKGTAPDAYWYVDSHGCTHTCLSGVEHKTNNACVSVRNGMLHYMCYGSLSGRCEKKTHVIGAVADLVPPEPEAEAPIQLQGGWVTAVRDDAWIQPFIEDLLIHKHVFIEGKMGTGKTSRVKEAAIAIRERIQGRTMRILCAGPRVLFEENQVADFMSAGIEINFYQSVGNDTIDTCDALSIQMESLARMQGCDPFDLVILDEIESSLKQFGSRTTMQNRLQFCAAEFTRIVQQATYTIWSDAFMSRRTLDCAEAMGIRGCFFKYTHQPLKRTAVVVSDADDFFALIVHSIMVEKKAVYVVCTSKRKADGLTAHLKTKGINFLYYCSDMTDEVRSTIQNVEQAWTAVVCIVTTPSITVGINFSLHHFDLLFVYASRHSCCARDWAQTTMRVRHIKDGRMYIHIAHDPAPPPTGLPITHAAADAAMAQRERALKAGAPAIWVANPQLAWLRGVQIANEVEDNNKLVRYHTTVYETLRECGYTIENFPLNKNLKRITISAIEPQRIIWEDVPDHPSNEMSATNRLAWFKKDYQRCIFLIKPELRDPAVNAAVFENIWTDTAGRQKLVNMNMEKNFTVKEAHDADFRSFGFAHTADGFGLKLEHIRAIKVLMVPTLMSGRDLFTEAVVISRERMEATAAYLAAHEAQLIEIFKVRDRTKVTTPRDVAWSVTFLNKIFGEWSFVYIKRKKCKMQENTVVTNYSKYIVESSCGRVTLKGMNALIC